MNEVHQAIETFCKYSPQEKIDFLVRLAHTLTILARDTYAVGEDGLTNPARLRIINEIQHRVTGCLMALHKNDPKRYPDDMLVRIILEHPEDLDLQRQLQETCRRLMGQMALTGRRDRYQKVRRHGSQSSVSCQATVDIFDAQVSFEQPAACERADVAMPDAIV